VFQKVAERLRHPNFSEETRKILLVVLFLLVLDVLTSLLAPYVSESVAFFSGKSGAHVLSDLLFLEGAVIFLIGALLFSRMFETKRTLDSGSKHVTLGVLLMIIGLGMIGLSIIIGELFA
jgi:nitric oxide reductase large subunit